MASTGTTFNDLKLAAKVRSLALKEIEKILLQPEMDDLKKQLILRLAANTLPRLNEHSGPDGGEIPIPIYGGKSIKDQGHNSNEKDIQS